MFLLMCMASIIQGTVGDFENKFRGRKVCEMMNTSKILWGKLDGSMLDDRLCIMDGAHMLAQVT